MSGGYWQFARQLPELPKFIQNAQLFNVYLKRGTMSKRQIRHKFGLAVLKKCISKCKYNYICG